VQPPDTVLIQEFECCVSTLSSRFTKFLLVPNIFIEVIKVSCAAVFSQRKAGHPKEQVLISKLLSLPFLVEKSRTLSRQQQVAALSFLVHCEEGQMNEEVQSHIF
jgi:hypothetical protein